MAAVPDLEPHCGSWVVSSRATGISVLETFSRKVAEAVRQDRYRVETAAQYLGRINVEIRAGSVNYNSTPD